MDEELNQAFYAPKKLFKKRIREESGSEDWAQYFNSDSFLDSPSSIDTNFHDSRSFSPVNNGGFVEDSSNSFTTKLLNGTTYNEPTKFYTTLKQPNGLTFSDDSRSIGWSSFESLQEKRTPKLNHIHHQVNRTSVDTCTSFIKSEPDDFFDYCGQSSVPLNSCHNSYIPVNGFNDRNIPLDSFKDYRSSFPKEKITQYEKSNEEAINLTVNQKQKTEEKIYPGILKEKLFKAGSRFIEKFSLQSLKEQLNEENQEQKNLIPIRCIHSSKNGARNINLLELKLEAMDNPSVSRPGLVKDISLHHLSSGNQYDNQVSSTNFDLDSQMNSTQQVVDDDLDELIESEILKTSFPLENVGVDKVSSSDSKMNQENSDVTPPKKQGKKWMKGDMICQVCGDKAAGFYCGAFACEACKKFFMRSCRNDKTKYVCLRDKKCQMTAESRVQCQYCRLQKCLSLNMYSPGSDVKKENVGDIPCRVCGAPSSGFHFGALTCEGCKGFFRRMAKERELGKYRCSKTGSCEINTSTRNLCKSCRYKKCVDAGMSIEGSRIGRQPNAVKYAISLEVKTQSGTRTEGDDRVGFSLEDLSSNSTVKNEIDTPESVQIKRPHNKSSEEDGSSPQKIVKQMSVFKPACRADYEETIKWIKDCDKDLKSIQITKQDSEKNILSITDVAEIWEEIVKPFYYHSSVIIKFAKKCQPFRKLALEDQVRMLQQALYPISILNHCRYYILETKQYSYFGWSVIEREHIWKYFPFYRILGEHFENTGDNVKLLGLDDDEFTILSTLVLLNPDVPGLIDKEKVRQLQAELLDFLEYYLSITYPDQPSRYGLVLVRLSELNFYAFQHLEGIREMLRVYPFLSMPQLYREMFINV
ncbi:uncharacterized protein LOC143068122 [Mytilus galloprovincialis]|uniref:uncharacterized protein LOC143068122 n=1 Tax=Mytilus galloprovincialis TaxID=29158 RepID=UPI003F7CA873